MNKSLSLTEKNRLIEIYFYLYIDSLLQKYNHSILVFDIVEALASLFNCNVTVLKKIMQGIIDHTHAIIPSKSELGVMLVRAGFSIRGIRTITKIHPQTLYKYMDEYSKDEFEFWTRLDEIEFEQVRTFMASWNDLTDALILKK